jgi:hypothetical protein
LANRYTTNELYPFDGEQITEIKFYNYVLGSIDTSHEVTVEFYEGYLEKVPGDLIISEDFIAEGHGWFNYNLKNTVVIDSSKDLWCALKIYDDQNFPGISDDTGGNPMKSELYYSYISTQKWYSFPNLDMIQIGYSELRLMELFLI